MPDPSALSPDLAQGNWVLTQDPLALDPNTGQENWVLMQDQ